MNVVEQRAQPFSQLYCAEEQTLRERASRVPDNGLIVDVGTAQGGSATIFQSVAGVRGVKIYSYDVADSRLPGGRLPGSLESANRSEYNLSPPQSPAGAA